MRTLVALREHRGGWRGRRLTPGAGAQARPGQPVRWPSPGRGVGGVADLAALIVAIALGSWLVYSTPWLWQVRLRPVLSVWPMVGFLFAGGVLGSVMTAGPGWASPVPLGRARPLLLIALASVAIGTLIFRTYWCASLHPDRRRRLARRGLRSAVREGRRRPWAESMVVVSAEKETVDQLAVCPTCPRGERARPWVRGRGSSHSPAPPRWWWT